MSAADNGFTATSPPTSTLPIVNEPQANNAYTVRYIRDLHITASNILAVYPLSATERNASLAELTACAQRRSQSNVKPADYFEATTASLDAEQKFGEDIMKQMARKNVTCRFFHPPERPNQLHVEMSVTPGTDESTMWPLGSQETIEFKKNGNLVTTNAQNILKQSIFAAVPTEVPGVHSGLTGWVGKTYLLGTKLCAKIENNLSDLEDFNLIRHTLGRHSDISVKVVPDDVRRERADRALVHLKMRLDKEAGVEPTGDEVPSFISQYHLNLGSIFLEDVPYQVAPGPRLAVKDGQTWALVQSGGNETQRRAILQSLAAPQGIACIQGPPATGKTTAIAHLLCNAVEMLDPTIGRIVCGAETNTAVHVMAARFRKAYGAIHGDKAAVSKIVVVDTQGKHVFSQLSGQGVPIAVRPLMLRAHMQRMAKKDPKKWKDWLDGETEPKRRGHILDMKLYKRHSAATRKMAFRIKMRKPVYFSTLATIHRRDIVLSVACHTTTFVPSMLKMVMMFCYWE